jgi:decaprenyl-phosphate phosphoribosyltransferase
MPPTSAAAVARPARGTVPATPPSAHGTHGSRAAWRELLSLTRPGQWPKSLLAVPLALVGAHQLTVTGLIRLGWAVVLFVLASALVYVWNDIADRERDRLHPTKSARPIAGGRVTVPTAAAFGVALALLLAAALLAAPVGTWWPLPVYLVLNVAYSRWLKHVPLVDVFIVAAGFILRVVQGYLAVGAAISVWLLISVFSLSLLLILGKRRFEFSAAGVEHRPSLRGYSAQYLEYLLVLTAVISVTAFLSYLGGGAFGAPYADAALMVSAPCAIFALARYLQLVVVQQGGDEPVRVLMRDRVLIVNSVVWCALLGLTAVAGRFPVLLDLIR